MTYREAATIALVGLEYADEMALRRILDCEWKVQPAPGVETAAAVLHRDPVAVVLCDRDAKPSIWRELLDLCAHLARPPLLVVTSRTADERLWAEALNLGAYDVLARPFEPAEVLQTLNMAYRTWQGRPMAAAAGMARSA